MRKILSLTFLFLVTVALSNLSIAESTDCRPVLSKTEKKIKAAVDKVVTTLELASPQALESVINDEAIEIIDSTNNTFDKKIFKTGFKAKMSFYKYVRSQGLKFNIKVPLDLDLVKKILNEVINKDVLDVSTGFEIEYAIEIDPNLKTGEIFRDDSIIFTPELTASKMVDNYNITGELSSSYIYTLARKYVGQSKSSDKILTDDEFVEPIKGVLKATPFFFKARCRQTKKEYVTDVKNNLNIPTTFNKLDELLISGDTLIYQKRSMIGVDARISTVTNFTSLTANIKRGRVTSINKVIHKTENPYKKYHMKTYFDSEDTVLEGGVSYRTGIFESDIVSWKPLDRLLKKPLRQTLAKVKLGAKERITYLNSYFLSLEDPRFLNIPTHIQDIKDTYDEFVNEYFIPSISHLKHSTKLIVDFRNHDSRKKFLDKELKRIIAPLTTLASSSIDIVRRSNIEVEEINTPNCEKIKLYPITSYFAGTRDLREQYFNFSIGLFKLASFKYRHNWKNKFYSIVDEYQKIKYFTQSLLNIGIEPKSVISKQDRDKQFYAITETTKNKNILKFKTFGFNYSYKDTFYSFFNEKTFYDELKKIVPFGKTAVEIKTKYKKILPYVKKRQAFLGYKYLLSQKGFERISKRVTHEVVNNDNFNFLYSILKNCMHKKDPNYNNKYACVGHLTEYRNYIRYKNYGEPKENRNNFTKTLREDTAKVDNALRAIAAKLTLIFLNNNHFYKIVDQQNTGIRKLVYKSNLIGVSKQARHININNAKYSLFNSLVSLGPNLSTTIVNGEQEVFKDMAPIALPYLLYYSFRGSKHSSFYIEPTAISDLDDYLYIHTLFRSSRFNKEERVKPKSIQNNDTISILNVINFFDFTFENVSDKYPFCEKNGQEAFSSANKLGL